MFVVFDDVIANPARSYDAQTYHSSRSKLKLRSQVGFAHPRYHQDAAHGNWLGLPGFFAAAMMMDDGWSWGQDSLEQGIVGPQRLHRQPVQT